MGTVLWNKTLQLHKVPCAKSVNRKINQMQSVCFACLPLNTGLAPRKTNPCTQEEAAYKSYLLWQTVFGFYYFVHYLCCIPHRGKCLGWLGRAPWVDCASSGKQLGKCCFSEASRQRKEWKEIPGARSLEDGSDECGPGRQASGDIAHKLCCKSVTELTENRLESKSLPGWLQQASGDLLKALKQRKPTTTNQTKPPKYLLSFVWLNEFKEMLVLQMESLVFFKIKL